MATHLVHLGLPSVPRGKGQELGLAWTSLPCVPPAEGKASPVQVIEEGEQVEGKFAPGLLLAVVEDVSIHDGDRIIHDLRAICRTVEVPGAGRGLSAHEPLRLPPHAAERPSLASPLVARALTSRGGRRGGGC